jgi:hypothetical protein
MYYWEARSHHFNLFLKDTRTHFLPRETNHVTFFVKTHMHVIFDIVNQMTRLNCWRKKREILGLQVKRNVSHQRITSKIETISEGRAGSFLCDCIPHSCHHLMSSSKQQERRRHQ